MRLILVCLALAAAGIAYTVWIVVNVPMYGAPETACRPATVAEVLAVQQHDLWAWWFTGDDRTVRAKNVDARPVYLPVPGGYAYVTTDTLTAAVRLSIERGCP